LRACAPGRNDRDAGRQAGAGCEAFLNEDHHIRKGDALLVVDVQRDFCPGGALPIAAADAILPRLNNLIDEALRAGALIVASRDWHPPNHLSFSQQGGRWPCHCVQHRNGAAFVGDLRLPLEALIITKGNRTDSDQYSAFDRTGLADDLRRGEVERVWICGLALDVCVMASALDSLAAGFTTIVVTSATAPVTQDGGAAALKELARAGVHLAD
jgi:nicotinamidase/pyrazinamidase